jgi:hypothetical protein
MSRKLTVLFLAIVFVLLTNAFPAMAMLQNLGKGDPLNGGTNPLYSTEASLWQYDNLETIVNNPLYVGTGNSGVNP